MRWLLTPDEFLLLWSDVGIARIPFPLQLRESAPSMDERSSGTRITRERFERGGVLACGRIAADLENALRTLAQPLLCCTAFGFYGPCPEQLVRIRAAHAGGAGVLAVQLAGPAHDVGGEVILSTVAGSRLAEAVVGALPAAKPGGIAAASMSVSPSSAGYSSINVVHTAAQRATERFQRLVEGPFSGAGQFVVTALDTDSDARKLDTLRWFDRPDDGRYLTVHGATSTVRPTDAATLTAALQEQISALARTNF